VPRFLVQPGGKTDKADFVVCDFI